MNTTIAPTKIEVPYPDTAPLELVLITGPCRVQFTTTDAPVWMTGTYEDPSGVLPIAVTPGARTVIQQRFDPTSGLWQAAAPRLALAFGTARPFAIEIQTGAGDNVYDLGGLPLSRVVVKAGAGRFELDWSSPNPTPLALIDVSAGAGAITARGLANANFSAMKFAGGMAACTLDFSGDLRRDANVRVDSGLGSIDLLVPATTALVAKAKTFATAKRATGAFTVRGDEYLTPAASNGARPLIEVEVSLAFGSIAFATT